MRTAAKVIAVLAAAVGLALPTTVTASAAVTATYNLWQWNVAGWKMHGGSATDGMVEVAAASIVNRNADFAAFNELCWDQYRALQNELRERGWPQDTANFSRWEPHHSTVCGGQAFGIAIFSRQPLGAANRYTLPDDLNENDVRHKLLCAPLASRPHLRFCTTHITTSNEVIGGTKINEQQLAVVQDKLEAFHAAGDTALIAGDFNARPNYGRLNNWYSPSLDVPHNGNNTGHYRELDDTDPVCLGYGETTITAANTDSPCGTGVKIDLMFVREDRLAGGYSADALGTGANCSGRQCSDHRALTGRVTVTVA